MLKLIFEPAFISRAGAVGVDVAVLADRVLDERAAGRAAVGRDQAGDRVVHDPDRRRPGPGFTSTALM